jgi:hypothetical protein
MVSGKDDEIHSKLSITVYSFKGAEGNIQQERERTEGLNDSKRPLNSKFEVG